MSDDDRYVVEDEPETETAEREHILTALAAFIRQRSGMDWRNYARNGADREGIRVYRQEQRSITRDLHDARELLAAVRWRVGIGAAELRAAFRAFSGRLVWKGDARGGVLDYCTGQYFPTEYRKAVCAVLASALWDYWRASMIPDHKAEGGDKDTYGGMRFGDAIHHKVSQELSRGVARRWFA